MRFTRGPRPQEHDPKEGRLFGPGYARKKDGGTARKIGAGEGNRTLVFSLEGCCSTIELHPRSFVSQDSGNRHRRVLGAPHGTQPIRQVRTPSKSSVTRFRFFGWFLLSCERGWHKSNIAQNSLVSSSDYVHLLRLTDPRAWASGCHIAFGLAIAVPFRCKSRPGDSL